MVPGVDPGLVRFIFHLHDLLGGGFKYVVFHPYLGKITILTT